MAIPNNPIRKRSVKGEGRRRGSVAPTPEGPMFPSGFSYDPEEEGYDLAYGPRDMRRRPPYQGGVATGAPMSEAELAELRQQGR